MNVKHSAWSVYTRKHKGLLDSYFIYVANALFRFIVLVNFGAYHIFSWLPVIFLDLFLIFALLQTHLVFFFFFHLFEIFVHFYISLRLGFFFFLEKGDMNKNK